MNYQVWEPQSYGDVELVAVGGELDLYAAPDVKEVLERSIDGGAKRLVLDLSETTFIDSTAIGVLLAARNRMDRAGDTLRLVCTHENVLAVIELAGLDETFVIDSSRDEALRQASAVT